MKAGRKLDVLVAKKVMGWESRYSIEDDSMDRWVSLNPPDSLSVYKLECGMEGWSPSTNIADAWRVVDKLDDDGWLIEIDNSDNEWTVWLKLVMNHKQWMAGEDNRMCHGTANTTPLAICLAAIKVMERKE